MREGVHGNVKAVVITSRLFRGVRVKLGFGGLREYMFDMWARERAEVPLREPYVGDYSIWFICVCMAKRAEFHRACIGSARLPRLRRGERSAGGSKWRRLGRITKSSFTMHHRRLAWDHGGHGRSLELHMLTFSSAQRLSPLCRDWSSAGWRGAHTKRSLTSGPERFHGALTLAVRLPPSEPLADAHLSQTCPSL